MFFFADKCFIIRFAIYSHTKFYAYYLEPKPPFAITTIDLSYGVMYTKCKWIIDVCIMTSIHKELRKRR